MKNATKPFNDENWVSEEVFPNIWLPFEFENEEDKKSAIMWLRRWADWACITMKPMKEDEEDPRLFEYYPVEESFLWAAPPSPFTTTKMFMTFKIKKKFI